MFKKRVLVVDDSAFMRKVISDIIQKDEQLELAGTARNGEDALKKLEELKPDVITLDVEMPKMNGLEALERIMGIQPIPVIMLSSLTQAGADITINALAKGAVDFIPKPGGAISLNLHEVENEILTKIKMASKVNLKQLNHSQPITKPVTIPKKVIQYSTNCDLEFPLVLIGTSTGGPKALHKVIENLPGGLEAGVLVVQHMPPGFTKSLAQRLDRLTNLHVKEAEAGDKITRGSVYIAPGDYHMQVEFSKCQPIIKLSKDPLVNGHRPSVDALFDSAAQKGIKKVLAVIMTGMGHDGRDGLVKLKKNGCLTIAEAEETCVVYGMPKSAVETGCVDKVVPLYNIAAEIVASLNLM